MKLVIIESPYAGDVESNTLYARRCLKDSLDRGEAPIASHLLYTQPGVLNDSVPSQRTKGINAGHAWLSKAQLICVYTDRGISSGMKKGIAVAAKLGIMVVYRSIEEDEDTNSRLG